jgi:hypothetical protein
MKTFQLSHQTATGYNVFKCHSNWLSPAYLESDYFSCDKQFVQRLSSLNYILMGLCPKCVCVCEVICFNAYH